MGDDWPELRAAVLWNLALPMAVIFLVIVPIVVLAEWSIINPP